MTIESLVEELRRLKQQECNALSDADIPKASWSTETLTEEYEVLSFLAPFVYVRRKSDGLLGSLMFRHAPRVYFSWEAET